MTRRIGAPTTAALPAFVTAAPLCRADYCGNRASVAMPEPA